MSQNSADDLEARKLETPIHDIDIRALNGDPHPLGQLAGHTLLIVNVASKCGLTNQYEGLERLQQRFGSRRFSVVGVPCNQFGAQEPASAQEIERFCSTTYRVTFPLCMKVNVNGVDQHPLYHRLVQTPDNDGQAGAVQWNFEKFLVSSNGFAVTRFRPRTEPEAPEVLAAIESELSRTSTAGTVPG